MSKSKKAPAEIQLILVEAMTGAAAICVAAYLSIWVIFSMWSGLTQTFPTLFRANACLFILQAVLIYQFHAYCKKEPYSNLAIKQHAMTAYIVISGLQVGFVHTYLIYLGILSLDEQYALRLISTGFAGIVGSLWGIANLTGLIYAIAVILPHIPASYFFHDPNANVFTILSCCLWFFLFLCSRKIQHNSFLQFVSNYRLTQVHADSMEHLSKKDMITKVNNRFHWLINFELLWKNSLQKNQALSLIGIQVGHLSEIIEAHGHQTGDAVMTNIASLLLESVDNPDLLGRYTGNQFMLVMPNMEYDKAIQFANGLTNSIHEKLFIPDQLCRPVYISTHVASSSLAGNSSAQTVVDTVSNDLLCNIQQ